MWRQVRRWGFAALVGVCALILLGLYASAVLDKQVDLFGKAALLLIAVVAAAATLIAREKIVEPGKGVAGLLTPKSASLSFLAIIAVFGFLSDAYGFLQPRAAVESEAGIIEGKVGRILDAVAPKAPEPPRILAALPGRWGEPGCAVRYDLSIQDRAVILQEVGFDYRSVGTIEKADGDALTLTTTEPLEDRGASTRLTYETNGVTETLTLTDQRSAVPLKLDRCP